MATAFAEGQDWGQRIDLVAALAGILALYPQGITLSKELLQVHE